MDEFVVEMPTRIDSQNAAVIQEDILAAVAEAIESQTRLFVVDMKETVYLSSAGLRVLNMAYKRIRARGIEFILRNVSDSVRDLLDVTGLSGYLPIE